MNHLLYDVFRTLDEAGISYCVLRGYDELDTDGAHQEVDILVERHQFPLLSRLLTMHGFVTLPPWGHAPHHFFVAYDDERDVWLKLDVVTELRYGRPVRWLDTKLASGCLDNRRPCGRTYVPSPEDECITLLLHVLLDKGSLKATHRTRLHMLCGGVTEAQRLQELWTHYVTPTLSWHVLQQIIREGKWQTLMRYRQTIARRLWWRAPWSSMGRLLTGMLLRRLRPILGAMWHRGLSVALLAPDGAGKTTLAQALMRTPSLRARLIYMGTNIDASTVGLPTTRWLHRRVKAHTGTSRRPASLLLKGLHFVNRLVEQWYRYGVARYHSLRGRLVIFDRYVYDAFLAPPASTRGKRVRRWLLKHTCPSPDLVVLLDAPGAVLYARKGEHTPERLEQQRQGYLSLQTLLPNLQVVDATREPQEVYRHVVSLIWSAYGARNHQKEKYEVHR